MARFDVYRGLGAAALLLDCQSDLLRDLNTRFVVPLLHPAHAPQPARRLNPLLLVNGDSYVMATQFAATVAMRELGPPVTSLADQDQLILNALDMLISGY
jgi:toxin CcdB